MDGAVAAGGQAGDDAAFARLDGAVEPGDRRDQFAPERSLGLFAGAVRPPAARAAGHDDQGRRYGARSDQPVGLRLDRTLLHPRPLIVAEAMQQIEHRVVIRTGFIAVRHVDEEIQILAEIA